MRSLFSFSANSRISVIALAVLICSLAQPVAAASSFPIWNGRITSTSKTSSFVILARGLRIPTNRKSVPTVSARKTTKPYLLASAPTATKQKDQPLLAVVNQPDIRPEHRQIANEVLMSLPKPCRDTLKNFYVRYEKPERRGLAGKSTMILDGTVPNDEFRALMVHEMGHVWDLGCLTGTENSGASGFKDGPEIIWNNDPSVGFYSISRLTSDVRKADSKDEDFVSGYASWDAFEDFSESFAYFVLHRDLFKERAQTNEAMARKYQWIQDNYFPNGLNIATTQSTWSGTVPWDITKLAYSWHPQVVIAAR